MVACINQFDKGFGLVNELFVYFPKWMNTCLWQQISSWGNNYLRGEVHNNEDR